ncbi:MAG: serine protease, partial [Firmicutes bacterium]|nr:serine protease [Bacillota bacterium]
AVPGQILRLVNEERAEAGLASLTLSDELSRAARAKAEDMAKNGYFSHTSPTYGSPFDQMHSFGITYSAAAENIAKGYPDADSVMTGWMNSEGHRANILNSSFTHLGVGYAVDEHGTTYWVQMFLKP